MNISYETNKWYWGGDRRCDFALKYRNRPVDVSVTSIDETGTAGCIINRARMLSRIATLIARGQPTTKALTCVAESTYSLTGVGITSYKWSIVGASFQQGTDVTSPTVTVVTNSDSSTRFTIMCSVNGGKILVNEEFKHQRWITDSLTPSTLLKPADDLVPVRVKTADPV